TPPRCQVRTRPRPSFRCPDREIPRLSTKTVPISARTTHRRTPEGQFQALFDDKLLSLRRQPERIPAIMPLSDLQRKRGLATRRPLQPAASLENVRHFRLQDQTCALEA